MKQNEIEVINIGLGLEDELKALIDVDIENGYCPNAKQCHCSED